MNHEIWIPRFRIWWIGLLLLCLWLEGVALYYQYILDQLPCVLCVHVRMLLFLLMVIGFFGLILRQYPSVVGLFMLAVTGTWMWIGERSYRLLATERGWIFDECRMQSGLPEWLALEEWLPWLFKIHEPCGYTPFLFFGITMAEALIVMSLLMVLASGGLLISYCWAMCRRV